MKRSREINGIAGDAGGLSPRYVAAGEVPSWRAQVVSRRSLRYDAGADPAQDRPDHVRAASAVAWFGGRLAVLQDDALFVAFVDPRSGRVDAVALPAAADGRRLFDEGLGNKSMKPDLEAGLVLAAPDGERLLAFGSGSTARRDTILVLRGARETPEIRVVEAGALYALLRDLPEFAGSELNVEGACAAEGGRLVRLFNRGNGAPGGGRTPRDATCDLDAATLLRWLDDPHREPPQPCAVTVFDLGTVDGVRLTFTDAEAIAGGVLYVAAAEASPDAVRDGPVAGVAVGVIDERGARWTRVLDERGRPLCEKIEGIAPDQADPRRVWAVVDADDPERPASLLALELAFDTTPEPPAGPAA
ncbi:MAG: hypothetical protein HY905_15345 [Deltaproteobacteria bacterium]|nr:hypothetical protein [Deltaproteobacteria bacterium]